MNVSKRVLLFSITDIFEGIVDPARGAEEVRYGQVEWLCLFSREKAFIMNHYQEEADKKISMEFAFSAQISILQTVVGNSRTYD